MPPRRYRRCRRFSWRALHFPGRVSAPSNQPVQAQSAKPSTAISESANQRGVEASLVWYNKGLWTAFN